jgi:hypothetical protein
MSQIGGPIPTQQQQRQTAREAFAGTQAATQARAAGASEEEVQRAASSAVAEQRQGEVQTVKLSIPKPPVNAGTGTALRYPSDLPITTNSDYVVFSFYKYAPPFGGGRDVTNQVTTSTSAGSTSAYSNYQSSNDRSYANPSKLKPIVLYMPEDIQSQFGAGWNGAGFGATAAGLMNLAGSATTQKDVFKILEAGVESIPGVIKTTAFSALISGINAAAGANINLNQALGTITGTIINPNVELAYEAPKLRNFSLKFKLVPRSGNESKIIRNICNTFKKSMLPSFGGQAIGFPEAGNLLTIPDLCQVSFMNGSQLHPYLPKYKLCGITDVNINYTAAGAYATYGDGAPAATEITISFLETKLIFAQEIDDTGDTGI